MLRFAGQTGSGAHLIILVCWSWPSKGTIYQAASFRLRSDSVYVSEPDVNSLDTMRTLRPKLTNGWTSTLRNMLAAL
jgi:hypothetical protein